MIINESQMKIIQEASQAQMSHDSIAGLLGMDGQEFNALLQENEELRRTLAYERSKGEFNLRIQLLKNGVDGRNHAALRDALKGLCGLDLDPKTSTKVEINNGRDFEAKGEDVDPDKLYLINTIYHSPISPEKIEEIKVVLRK